MAEPLIASAHVVVDFDADARGWAVRDWTPGPAGTAPVELAGGIELDVDVAAPRTLAGLWVPERSASHRVLARLLGHDRAAELAAVAAGPVLDGRDDRRVTRLGRRRTTDRGSGLPAPGVDGRLFVLALAAAAATGSSHPLVRSLAHLEATSRGALLGRGLGRRTPARASALAGSELLLDVARRGELDDQPVDGPVLVAILGDVVPLLPDKMQAEVGVLAAAVTAGRFGFPPEAEADRPVADGATEMRHPAAAGAAELLPLRRSAPDRVVADMPRAAAPKKAVSALLDLDDCGLPLDLVGAGVAVRATTASEAEVRVPRRADDAHRWWARAHGPDGVVLAATPFQPDGADAVARLLVPPAALRDATFDVTDQPGEPRPSAAALAVLDAVAWVKDAARAERLRRPADAAARWRRYASSWDRAGAEQQAGLARRYAAEGGAPIRVPPPLLADPLLESLERVEITCSRDAEAAVLGDGSCMRERTDPTKVAMLRAFPGLNGATDEHLARMASSLDVVDVPAGQRLFTQGRFGRSVYLIVRGMAIVERDGEAVAGVSAGDVVGEMGPMLSRARNATVESLTSMRLLVAGPAAVGALFATISMPTGRAAIPA